MNKNNKINILFVIVQLAILVGSEKVVLELAQYMDPTKFNIYLSYFYPGPFVNEFKKICRDIFYINKKDGIDLSSMIRISKIIQDNDIDVITAHHYMPLFYSYLGSKILNKNKKLFYVEHSVPEVMSVISTKHKKVFGYMLNRLDGVIGISKEIYETFKNSYPKSKNKFKCIINGVDVKRFKPAGRRNELRSEWGITPDHFVIGTVANFRKVKNHACLIRAINKLHNAYPQIRLLLVGQGFSEDAENSEKEVFDLVNDYGLHDKVILTGFQEDIPSYLNTFDVFCLPSLSEGIPVSILEAMAAYLPVIASDVRGIREVVTSEITGLLFPSNDANSLAEGLERLINDECLRKMIANNAYCYVSKEHAIEQWVASYEQLFT